MNILADLQSDTNFLGVVVSIFVFLGGAVTFCSAVSYFSDCKKKGFTPERVEIGSACLSVFFLCMIYFPIVNMWHDCDVKAEADGTAPYSSIEGSPATETKSIKSVIVGITIGVFMGILGGWRQGYANSQGEEYPAFNVFAAPIFGIIALLLYLSWGSGAYLN